MVMMTFVGGEPPLTLHRTPSGFQFGLGRDAQIITNMDEVKDFHPSVQTQVQAWLNAGGVKQANQARTEQEISDRASELPGTLDAMAEKLGPGVKAQIYEMLKSFVQGGGITSSIPPANEVIEKVDGGSIVSRPGQMKEFVVDETQMDEPELEMVGVGTGSDSSMAEEIQDVKNAQRRPVGRPRKD